jgi:hypothetical protein
MKTLRMTFRRTGPGGGMITPELEGLVTEFIKNWHNEDNLQEVLNMAFTANNIPAAVIKIGGASDELAFEVEPYPYKKPGDGKKLNPGFSPGQSFKR